VSEQEKSWVSVKEFASYLGVSTNQVYRLRRTDPDVQRVTKELGGRVMVCLSAWKDGVERRMAGGGA
jgi:hypothetical protein